VADQIVLDLGEYGTVVVDAEGPDRYDFGATRGRDRPRRRIDAAKLLRAPLTGLARLMVAALPEPRSEDRYEIDELQVEFGIGIETEVGATAAGKAGVSAGAVADVEGEVVVKVTPNGAFKCTYTWRRKDRDTADAPTP